MHFYPDFLLYNVWDMRLIFNNYLSAKTIFYRLSWKVFETGMFQMLIFKAGDYTVSTWKTTVKQSVLISTYAFPINNNKYSFQCCDYNDSFVGLFNAEVLYKASRIQHQNQSHYSVIIVNYTSFLNHYPKSRRLEKRCSMQ